MHWDESLQNRAGFKKLFILNKNKAENLNGDYKAFTVCLWLLVCTEKKNCSQCDYILLYICCANIEGSLKSI